MRSPDHGSTLRHRSRAPSARSRPPPQRPTLRSSPAVCVQGPTGCASDHADRFRRRQQSELGGVRSTHRDQPGSAEAADQVSVRLLDEPFVSQRGDAFVERITGAVRNQVLDDERNARGTGCRRSKACSASFLARSKRSWITALRTGLICSMAVIDSSTNSRAEMSPRRTASACAVASIRARSSSTVALPLAETTPSRARRPAVEQQRTRRDIRRLVARLHAALGERYGAPGKGRSAAVATACRARYCPRRIG